MPDNLAPLGVDRCKLDHDAPCFYWHLKLRALNGERDVLSQAELAFVGVGVTPRARDGWRAPRLPAFEPDEPLPETTAFLRALMTIGQGQLEFLA